MTDLLANIKQQIANNTIEPSSTPIVDEALALVSHTESDFKKRLPKIFELMNQAIAAGGVEKAHAGYIIENLYASASEDEFNYLTQYIATNTNEQSS